MKDQYGFSKNLRHILSVLGMSKAEFARRTGLTPAAVTQLCNGDREPSLQTIVRILKVLPVKFEMLVKVRAD
jgi:transcriptional regulator with XRE-family HTH domain